MIPHRPRPDRGFSLVEALAAATILAFALLVAVSVVAWADRIEARAARRVGASELAASVAERIRAAPHASLASGELDLSTEVLPPLPDPHVFLEVESDDELQLKTVGVIVTWGGDEPGRLRLDTKVGAAEIYRP